MTDCQSTGRDDKSVRPKGNYTHSAATPRSSSSSPSSSVTTTSNAPPLPHLHEPHSNGAVDDGGWSWEGWFMAHIKTPFYTAIHVFVDDKGNIMFVCLRARFLRRLTSDRDDWYHVNKRLLATTKKKKKMSTEYWVWVVNVKIGINAYILL